MRDMPDTSSFDGIVRRAWTAMLHETLPAAAPGRGWPVGSATGFERLLLDHVLAAPWESVIASPSSETADPLDLVLAIEMGERLVEGLASISELNRRSLAMRAARAGPAQEACDRCSQSSIIDDDAVSLIRRAIASARAARPRG